MMYPSNQTNYQNRMNKNHRRSFWKNFVRVMCGIVVFCTTYALILPAITMENKTFCGFEEHEHSEACYLKVGTRTLTCSTEQLGVHTHGEDCYDAEGLLVCDLVDYVIHSHNEDCYDQNGHLICMIPEHPAHVHDEHCYAVAEDSLNVHRHGDDCYKQEKGELVCELEETEGHTHGADCFASGEELICAVPELHVHDAHCYEYPLICDSTDEAHIHEDACYEQNLICSISENHVHADSCFERILICGNEEGQAHVHTAECYGTEGVLSCEIPENHTHDDSCYNQVLQCEIPESSGHLHDDHCYAWTDTLVCELSEEEPLPVDPVLICTEPEAEVHVHSESCFELTDPEYVLLCTDLSEDHEHIAQCYELDCGKKVHTHSAACYSNPEADLETASDWEADFADIELTGDWSADVLTIAQTQLGYKESAKNYDVWPDESIHGYTRYGEWYGIPYGDWCAMFASFCLEYAQVEDMPHNACVIPWIEELTELKLYHCAEVYTPKPGDLIFYDWNGDEDADHVGFVAEIIPETEFDPAQVKALEGNSSNCVQYVYYVLNDEVILGYSELPENAELYDCGRTGHRHNEYCYQEDGTFICELSEHFHDDACLAETPDHIAQEPATEPAVYYCGLNTHIHGVDCYNADGSLNCGAEAHDHTDVCRAEPVTIVYYCGLEEHTHAEDCIDADGNLLCTLVEHTHETSCEVKTEDSVADDLKEETLEFFCGLTVHVHGVDCYNEDGSLNCGTEEHDHTDACTVEPIEVTYFCNMVAHAHSEECYDENGDLICEIEEHSHNEACEIEPVAVYYCGLDEHTHVEACYDAEGNLLCSLEEHVHEDICMTEAVEEPKAFYCGMEEHTHGEDCLDEAGNLTCELEEHSHTEVCEIEPVAVYYCGLDEHTHVEACYDAEGNLLCSLEEHVHEDICMTEAVEEPKVFYCGMEEHTHGEDCLDEVGNLTCELEEHSHTEVCEIEPVVVYYCGREEHVHDDVCYGTEGTMVCPLKPHTHGDECLVAPNYQCNAEAHLHGEACFGEDGALICTLSEHTHTEKCEGFTCGAQKHIHGSGCYQESGTLICRILEHEHNYLCRHYICGKMVHVHGYWCYDVNKNLACGQEEHRHDGACLRFDLVYEDQNMIVSATITGVEMLPEDVELVVIPVTQETDPEQFASMSVAVSEELASSNQLISDATFYDLKLKSAGSFYDLPEMATVTVTMDLKAPVFAAESDTKAFMITPNEAAAEDAAADETESSLLDSVLDSLEEAVSELFVKASATEVEEENPEQNDTGSNYQASGIDVEHITTVTSQTNQLPTIGFALTRDASFSEYWERVESLDELKADEKYIIVSAEGNYALLGVTGDNAVPVQLDPIEGHRKNYIITLNATDVTTANLLWKFTPSGDKYQIQNEGTSRTLYPYNRGLFGTGNSTVISLDDNNENCWRISGNGYYLRFHPGYSTKQFGYTNSHDNNLASDRYSDSTYYYNARDMLIFRMLPADSYFERPANYDSIKVNNGNTDDENTLIAKPDDYGSFVDTSDGLTGDTSLGSVSGKYYSDYATSQLESHFRKEALVYCGMNFHIHDDEDCYDSRGTVTCGFEEHTHVASCLEYKSGVTPVLIDEGSLIYEMTELNDGMVRTDKSVIYGYDDYQAFNSYGNNTFGVALSALGQAYPISSKYQVETPVDVVFVLDCSGSMSSNTVSNNQYRIQAMVEALNGSIKSIMESNDANRVGVVLYAQGTNEVLPLNRYTANNHEYFICNQNYFNSYNARYNVKVDLTGYTKTVYRVYTSSSLKTESGSTQYQNLGRYTYQGLGTYTQAGIAMGSKVFHDIPTSETTYSQKFEDGTTIKTQRQPVFILLSDGEPTYSTSMYTDALNGVHYGDGMANSDQDQVKGIHGYYTILSANHYKRMVSIHYDRPALFFSIGLGLNKNDGTSIDYKKAVLDPSKELLDELSDDGTKYDNTSKQLLNLLASNSGVQSLQTNVYWPDDWIGIPHMYEPTMPNPFENYDYADESFFGNYSGEELLGKFNEILEKSLKNTEYGFVLVENTGVAMSDYIGAGMEIKGAPILRYGGQNYTNTKVETTNEVLKDIYGNVVYDDDGKEVTVPVRTYTYSYKYQPNIPQRDLVDLATIKIRITDNLPLEHIYLCGIDSASHTHTEECGIYYSYLCGHHPHRLSCHEGNTLDGKLICDDPHDHEANGCVPITTTQKVEMIIPDTALPIYMPDLVSSNFYYEALPVRLIYQVGLTEEAEEAVAALADNGGELTFYTNRWGGNQHARSDLHPALENPFYYDQTYTDPETGEVTQREHTYEPHVTQKAENVTGTEDYSTDCHEGDSEIQIQEAQHVYHELGNNGKLVFSVDTVDIPVEKLWSQGSPIPESGEVEVTLYQITPSEGDALPVGRAISTQTITPNSDGEWTMVFTNVAIPTGNWYYAIAETPVEGYEATYSGAGPVTFLVESDSGTAQIVGEKVSITEQETELLISPVTITNTYQWSYELPKTGGSGTTPYYALGISLIAMSCALYMVQKISKKKRGIHV